jgi:predicted negative regulator of RcsB-dependent stress response
VSDETGREKFRPSFYLTINSLFILLILGVGGIPAWQIYLSTQKIVPTAADRDYDQVHGRFPVI